MKKYSKASLVAGIFSLALSSVALAGDLLPSFDFETTAVLPQGVRNPRFKDLVSFMDTKFGGSGGIEALGAPLNKAVSWRDVIDGQDDAQLKSITQGKIQSLGYNLDDSAGGTSGNVNVYMNTKVPVLAAGITDRLTLAVAVPIVTVNVSADTGFVQGANGQAQALVNSICKDDPDKCTDAAQKLNDAVNTKLKRLGYQPIEPYTKTAIGDTKLVGKYLAYASAPDSLAVKAEVDLPTGVAPDVNKALDTPTGDGTPAIGAGLIYDRFLDRHKEWRANAYVNYLARLPDHIDKRLPTSENDPLSADKENVSRDLGDIATAGTSLNYQFPWGLRAAAGYAVQRMFQTTYSGTQYAPFRYSLLEAQTTELMHNAVFGLGFSSVQMYLDHQFAAPFELNVAYSKPLGGFNVVRNELMSFELVLFF